MSTLAILGPGGVGGFLAGALTRAGEPVTLIAREQTAATLAREGLHVQSVRLGDFEVRPEVTTVLREPGATLIVSTKATGLEAALSRIEGEPALVVPLLNGLDHLARLRQLYGTRAVAGAIRIESHRPRTGRIVQASPFLGVELASADPDRRPALDDLAARLEGAQVPCAVLDSEAQVMWSKLVRLNALALTTSAADLPLGELRQDPHWRAQLEQAVREGTAVGCAEGAELADEQTLGELADAHPGLRSSMQRDIAAGREPELDAIAGSVLRAAARHGLRCPTIEALVEQVAARAGVPAPAVAAPPA